MTGPAASIPRGSGVYSSIAGWCLTHRTIVVLVWLGVFGGGLFASQAVLRGLGNGGVLPASAQSMRVAHEVDAAQFSAGDVLILVDDVDVASPVTVAALGRTTDRLAHVATVTKVQSTYSAGGAQLRSADGRATLVGVRLEHGGGLPKDATLSAIRAAADPLTRELPGARISYGGDSVLYKELIAQTGADMRRGELISLPATLIVLVLVFGGLRAGLIPVLSTLATIGGAFIALYCVSHVLPLNPNVPTVVSVLGLGLSIDYGLLVVSRFRLERRSHDVEPAVRAAAGPALRTVAFSVVVVAASLAALFAFPSPLYRSVAAGGISVAVIALAASVTLTPALLGAFGSRIRVRRPARHGRTRTPLLAVARWVTRHPWPVLAVTALVLAGLGMPVLRIRLEDSGSRGLPASFASRQVFDTIGERFGGGEPVPILVLARTTTTSMTTYAAALRLRQGVRIVTGPTALPDGAQLLSVVPSGAPTGPTAQRIVRSIHADALVFDARTGGPAAAIVDMKDMLTRGLPLALTMIACAALALLYLMSRSVVVPLKSVLMNVLSLGASFGALVLIFQDGKLAALLGIQPVGSIETWIPVLVFVFAFALSMDYEVFLIAGIKELRDEGMDNTAAVVHGLHRSGKLITQAALLMVVVFAGFAAGKTVAIKEIGMAMAIAIITDATLIRCLLLPATMALLGEANWWAPWRRGADGIVSDPAPGEPGRGAPIGTPSHSGTPNGRSMSTGTSGFEPAGWVSSGADRRNGGR